MKQSHKIIVCAIVLIIAIVMILSWSDMELFIVRRFMLSGGQ